ncbi:hypothetical protein [Flavobacterium macrobrachii]|uniref:Peptidase S74 domain-containing protein n=1 Tax=Flavobacterium macrobrachii TaxID=591204 RepID=A0ABS2CWR6_9FLAO|nr:hypothetical protein [Flavobacterium macrobrachii]MBM6499398.1 hypothetical protein [Flavobacterium macrobrachii]
MLTEKELVDIETRANQTQNGPWKAYIEGRDHESGSNFIMTGVEENRGEDIEMIGATIADYEFIANAKQDIPKLTAQIRELRRKLEKKALP